MRDLKTRIFNKLPFVNKILNIYKFSRIDVLIISYPKCGRTWLRVILINYLQSHFNLKKDLTILDPAYLSNLNNNIPRIAFSHGGGNPIKKTPSELIKPKKKFMNKKIILLVRDPKDVIVSSYFQEFNRDSNEYKISLSEYLFGERGGIDTIIKYYENWYDVKNEVNTLNLVKYEDLKQDTKKQMGRILHFIGIDKIDSKKLEEAINFGSFDNMKKMEKDEVFETTVLKPRDKNDNESYKTRRGKVGGFVDYLNSEEIDKLNKKIKKLPKWYGYEKN